MNSKTALIVVIVLILAALGLWYSAPGMTGVSETATSTAPAEPAQGQPPKSPTPIQGGNTYKSLLTQKGNYQCDYDQVQSTGQGHNVIYLSDGKMRAEFHNVTGDVKAGSLSVYDGRYLYVWDEGKTVGTRTTVTSLGQLPAAIPKDLTSGKIYGTAYESVGWKCHTWLVDKTLLVPPAYVKFQ